MDHRQFYPYSDSPRTHSMTEALILPHLEVALFWGPPLQAGPEP